MAASEEFWTAEEVSNYLRIPQSTIYKLAQDKILPGFKVGKHWRFRRVSIYEWINRKENNNRDITASPNIESDFLENKQDI